MTDLVYDRAMPLRIPDADPYLVPLMSRGQKALFYLGVALWVASLVYFWGWWLRPEHNISTLPYVVLSVLVAWVMLLPLYFVAVMFNAKKANPKRPAPTDVRVAMVVTKAPSEPFPVVRETLCAMLGQTYPHDTWLADEDPSAETIAWCEAHGVFISTRRGREDYHRTTWPRRTRCKEGNLSFFYDHYGYENYDIVSQLDADHVPSPTYLEEMVKPFADPSVGYVSAPSICDKNAAQSWSARGRLYVEGMFHGPLQVGYTGGWAPLCIGSHYAVRTRAVKEIGGLGPELAEDHSTTLMMNAHGWRGVHAIDAIAHGDGPNTFADLATQEFQWSRSLVTILLQYSPKYVPMLPPRLKFQFLFSQLWYPFFSSSMAAMYLLPIIALVFDFNYAQVSYPNFILHALPVSVTMMILCYILKSGGWARPVDTKIVSWEAMVFALVRWPWSILGTVAACRDWITGTFVDFRVTPKGAGAVAPLPFRVVTPYALLAIGSAIPALVLPNIEVARGFYVLACLSAAFYAVSLMVIVGGHLKENGLEIKSKPVRIVAAQAGLVVLASATPVAAIAVNGQTGIQAIAWGTQDIGLTKLTYTVSGAGHGGRGITTLKLNPDFFKDMWRRD